MFQAIFFDMDGVTVDTEPQWQESERELMSEFNYEWRKEDEVACLGGPLSRVGIYMSEKVGKPHPGEWFTQALINRQMEKMRQGVEILPGVETLVGEFRAQGLPVALVSASPRNIMDAVFAGLSHHLFDFSISADDVTRTKPDPEPYLVAASRAGVDIRESLVIEDSLTGITSAKAAGAYILAVPHFISIEEEPRLKVVSSLAGVLAKDIVQKFFLS